MPNFEFSYNKIQYNLHQMNLSELYKRNWLPTDKEAFKYSKILYDPKEVIKKFYEYVCPISVLERESALRYFASKIPPFVSINPHKQFQRGHYITAYFILNKSIEIIIDALFWINWEHVPNTKWKVYKSLKLKWLPKKYKDVLDYFYSQGLSKDNIKSQIYHVNLIAEEVLVKIEKILKKDRILIYKDACPRELQRQILEVTFSDIYLKKIDALLDVSEKDWLYNYINYNFISTQKELLNSLKYEKNIVSKKILKKITR